MKTEDQRIVQSRQAIIEAGIHTLLLNPRAGMSEIAIVAGVGRATLYRHFETKEVLVKALTKLCLEETDEVLKPVKDMKGRLAIEAIIDRIMPLAKRFRFLMSLWALAENDKGIIRTYQRQLAELTTTFDQAKALGEIQDEIPTKWLVASFDATLNTAWALVENGDFDENEAATYFKRSFFEGCQS